MQHNLIRNGYFTSLTTPGTGNKLLSWTELSKLMDNNTTSSGVLITSGDVLYLETDLSNRIMVDSVRLYASDLTKLSNINFYYKNSLNDSYTLCTKNVSDYYYITVPSFFAPQYVLVTISGIDIELYEHSILSDDYIVGFGDDGNDTQVVLRDTPVGQTSDPTAVEIFNNGAVDSLPVNAYICVDYTGEAADKYLKISSSVDGTYYGIEDGGLIEDNREDSIIRFSMGVHDNTTTNLNTIVIDDKTLTSGTWTTPVFKLEDPYNSSYFIVDGVTISGTTESGTITSISNDPNVYNGTIEVRSSNEVPLACNELYWHYRSGTFIYASKYIVYTEEEQLGFNNIAYSFYSFVATYLAVADAREGRITVSYMSGSGNYYLLTYDRDGNAIYGTGKHTRYYCDIAIDVDGEGNIWGAGTTANTLFHIDYTLTQLLAEIDPGYDFVQDLAAEMNGTGVWYTDKVIKSLIHLDIDGNGLSTAALYSPYSVCGTSDNGCWVSDTLDHKVRRYNYSGVLVKTVNIGVDATSIVTDYNDGFWYLAGRNIGHVSSNGTILVSGIEIMVGADSSLMPIEGGCAIWSNTYDWVKFLDENGSVYKTYALPNAPTYSPCILSISHDRFIEGRALDILPVSYDPVWSDDSLPTYLSWKEVKKDGYFLPKLKYHQARITLRNNDGVSTPLLQSIGISPSVKVQDIQPQTSKNIYVKTNFPGDIEMQDYDSRIKCWWEVEE